MDDDLFNVDNDEMEENDNSEMELDNDVEQNGEDEDDGDGDEVEEDEDDADENDGDDGDENDGDEAEGEEAEGEDNDDDGEGEDGEGEDGEGEDGDGEDGDGKDGDGEDGDGEDGDGDGGKDNETGARMDADAHPQNGVLPNGQPKQPQESVQLNSATIRANAVLAVKNASEFDIVPMVAIPYVQQCHAVATSAGPKWLLTGGEDGFIRKYDFAASIDGKAPLTVAQKHNLMDNVNKAGVIGSYWENEQPMTRTQILNSNPKFKESDFSSGFASYEPRTNPVYSLDVERNGYWCLSGLLSGGISLYTMIYNEGNIHHYFRHSSSRTPSLDSGHLDAVSVLRLNHAQSAFLSGLWDKTIREWDLNTGKTINLYTGSTGQLSSIQYRPRGLTDLSFEGQSDVDSLFGSDEDDEAANQSKSSIRADKSKPITDDKVFMSSSIDGTINIWDARVSGLAPALKLGVPEGVPPWCMTAIWSNDGDKIYAGRRNGTVDEMSLRMPHTSGLGNVMVPNVLKRLIFPKISGPVSALSVMPNDNFLFCGSNDNIRLYNLNLYDDFVQESAIAKKRATPFYVIPGHHGGVLSNLIVDDTGRFMISTSGNRGWGHAPYADVVLVYSIDTDAAQQ